MKKCIKLSEGVYINPDHIVTFVFEKECESILLCTDPKNESLIFIRVDDKINRCNLFINGDVLVSVQEYHRIKRELCEYFDIDPSSIHSSNSSE